MSTLPKNKIVRLVHFCELFLYFYRTYRYAAYRQFTWWAHNRVGRHIRRVIPACVVKKIREEFPEPDQNYTGFKSGNEVDEINIVWIYEKENI